MGRGRKNFGKTREYMWYEQGGKCFFCGKVMVWREFGPEDRMSHDDATVDHLDERASPKRGICISPHRRVLSCHQCNHQRGVDFVRTQEEYSQLSFYHEFPSNHLEFIVDPVE